MSKEIKIELNNECGSVSSEVQNSSLPVTTHSSLVFHDYHVLKEIEKNPSHTQRSLAEKLNISLGKVNFVMSGLIEKGIVKAKKLRNHPDKIRWQYILTADGITEKVRITKDYMNKRIREFEQLKVEIEELEREVGKEKKDEEG